MKFSILLQMITAAFKFSNNLIDTFIFDHLVLLSSGFKFQIVILVEWLPTKTREPNLSNYPRVKEVIFSSSQGASWKLIRQEFELVTSFSKNKEKW